MVRANFIYDSDVNSLVVFREDRQSYGSIHLGEIIINIDKNFQVSAVEVLNPDKLYGIPKKKLLKISSASIQVQQRGPVYWIYIMLKYEDEEIERLPVQVQLEHPISA